MKKNEKLLDAIGQIDERYIAEALEPLKPEDTGISEEKKTGQQKKGSMLFFRQRRQIAAAAALVVCIGAAGIAQWKLHSEELGGEISNYEITELTAEDGIALQAEDAEERGAARSEEDEAMAAAIAPDANENEAAAKPDADAASQNAAQGRAVDNLQTCFAEIYLEVVQVDAGKITWRIVNESSTESVSWDNGYTLERLTENGWEIVEKAAASETPEDAADKQSQGADDGGQSSNVGTARVESGTIAAGETAEETLDLNATGIQLETGQYRLKKECRIFDDENSSQTELTAEFQVEP